MTWRDRFWDLASLIVFYPLARIIEGELLIEYLGDVMPLSAFRRMAMAKKGTKGGRKGGKGC